MPLDKNPTKPAKPWVPDLLFDPVPAPRAPAAAAAPAVTPAPEERPVELAAATGGTAVQESTPQLVERPAPQELPERSAPQAPAISESDDPADLRRILAEHEKALNKVRILRRNLQEDISKARRTFMFAERTRLYSAKGALDALVAQEQQGEIEERRLASEILAVRARLERLSR